MFISDNVCKIPHILNIPARKDTLGIQWSLVLSWIRVIELIGSARQF